MSPSSLKGKRSPIVSCFLRLSSRFWHVTGIGLRSRTGQASSEHPISAARTPCRTAAVREAPGEAAHHDHGEGVPDSSLGLRSNATIPRLVRSPSSCTLKGVPERSSCRAMCVACTAFRVRMLVVRCPGDSLGSTPGWIRAFLHDASRGPAVREPRHVEASTDALRVSPFRAAEHRSPYRVEAGAPPAGGRTSKARGRGVGSRRYQGPQQAPGSLKSVKSED